MVHRNQLQHKTTAVCWRVSESLGTADTDMGSHIILKSAQIANTVCMQLSKVSHIYRVSCKHYEQKIRQLTASYRLLHRNVTVCTVHTF